MPTDCYSMHQPEVFECIYGLFTHIMRWSRQLASGLRHITATVFRHIIVTTQSHAISHPIPTFVKLSDLQHFSGDMHPCDIWLHISYLHIIIYK
jgi:hypothetical protein